MTTLIMTSIMLSTNFMFLKHPLSMGLLLILQTLLLAMMSGLMANNFWFAYILTITMLSGALVLFIYMASIASNEKFKSPMKTTMMYLILMPLIPLSLFSLDQLSFSKNWSSKNKMLEYFQESSSLIKFFSTMNMFITISLVLYLLLSMIVVSNIVNNNEGALRKKN